MSDDAAARDRQALHIFRELLDLAPENRNAAVDQRCGDDAALRERVAALLSADAPDDDTGPRPLRVDAAVLAADAQARLDESTRSDDPRLGRRVGAYRLERVLGEGGMGTVFLASRDDGQFRQQLALKFIRGGGADDAAVRRRFEQERSILAGLSHPDIVRLLDGGVLEDGQPWYAMEYIAGQAITTWCDAQRASVKARVALVARVADAVQAAHQLLVVHRDLKPSNILIDATGAPHVLDFGIAKLLDPAVEDAPRTATRWMTPEYAAPEQIRGETIGTATDVYALGVLLYELLAGVRPFGRQGLDPFEVQRAILEQEPARLSAAVATGAQDPEALAARRGTVGSRLRRLLRGDLDRVVRKALAKASAARYASAGALADDLRRWLDGRPVLATPPASLYLARRFVSRHRAAVAAAVLVVASLLGATLFSLQQARVARAEAARANEVQRFLIGIFEQQDPDASGGARISAKDLIDRAERQLDAALDDAARLALLQTLIQLRYNLGDSRAALRLGDRLVAFLEAQPATDAAALGQALVDRGDARAASGDTAGGASDCERGLSLLREADAARQLGLALLGCAAQSREAHDFERASARLDEAEALLRRYGSTPAEREYKPLRARALLLGEQDRNEEAVVLDTRLIDALRADPHTPPSDIGTALHNRATHYGSLGRTREALADYRAALEQHQSTLGPAHPLTVHTQARLALTLHEAGETEEAMRLNRDVVALARQAYAPDSATLAIVLSDAAIMAYGNLDLELTATLMQEAVDVMTRAQGAAHEQTLQLLTNLAAVQRRMGRCEAARATADSVLERLGPSGAGSNVAANARYRVGQCALARGDNAGAIAQAQANLQLLPPKQAGAGVEVVHALDLLAMATLRTGDTAAAADAAARLEVEARAVYEPGTSQLADAIGTVAWVASMRGEYARADRLAGEVLSESPPAPESWNRTSQVLAALARTRGVIAIQGRQAAEPWLAALRKRRATAPPDEALLWADVADWLGPP